MQNTERFQICELDDAERAEQATVSVKKLEGRGFMSSIGEMSGQAKNYRGLKLKVIRGALGKRE